MVAIESVCVLDQEITDRYAAYNADTVPVTNRIPDASVGLSVFSPPFESLYCYSGSARDFGNSTREQFWDQYRHLIANSRRVMKPGRIIAIHCMMLPVSKQAEGYIGMRDFPGEIVRAYQAEGFIYHGKVYVWKDPVTQMQRTKALGLLHKTIRTDSSMSRPGIADEIVFMRAPGENVEPISRTAEEFPVEQWQRWASPIWVVVNGTDPEGFGICGPDINPSETLQHRSAREDADERHIAPLQLEVIRRVVLLWSNPGDTVWSPFMGIGSEGVVALQNGRKFIGAELKRSYYAQAVANLRAVASPAQRSLF